MKLMNNIDESEIEVQKGRDRHCLDAVDHDKRQIGLLRKINIDL